MENCEKIVSESQNTSITDPVKVLTRSAAETQSPGSTTVLVAYFDGQVLTWVFLVFFTLLWQVYIIHCENSDTNFINFINLIGVGIRKCLERERRGETDTKN